MKEKQQPKEYECIAAWDKMMGSGRDYTSRQIEKAKEDKAPEDAIFFSISLKKWTRLQDVTSAETRWFFTQNYPWLVAKYTDWESRSQQSSSK